METRIMMVIVLPNNSVNAEARICASQWEGDKLIAYDCVYEAPARIKPLEKDANLYPWTVAAIRDVADDAVASMLTKMAQGEVLLIHPVEMSKEM